ncbi:MAG: trimeric intracellular cation channel family protein [Verrucomicrobiaceae bacterium]|nr:trimeric intracellular cation channel family protein [Verrucomicrobiaceae bacterium]
MKLVLLLDHFGVCVGALTGVLAARGRRLDLFGVLVLALVTAFGGGSLRDLLIGDTPVSWLKSPHLFATACGTALVSFVICRGWEPPGSLLQVADAFALGFFSLAGTTKGLNHGFAAPVSVMLGVVTGVAGGIIRDVLTSRVPLVFQQDTWYYATAAIAGSGAYCALRCVMPDEAASWAGVGIAIFIRLAAIRYRLSLPAFESRDAA